MLKFNSRSLFALVIDNPQPEKEDFLGDMKRAYTIADGPSNRDQANKILKFFDIQENVIPQEHGLEYFMEMVYMIKMRVFSQISNNHIEWRVDWSRKDHAFCLWYRIIGKEIDETTDLDFARKSTLNNIINTEIKHSTVHGLGLFAMTDFDTDQHLAILDGQVIHKDAYEYRLRLFELQLGNLRNYFFMEWNVAGPNLLLVRPFRTKYSYINHQSKNNVILVPEEKNHMINIICSKPIKNGEELFLDYRKEALPRSYFHLKTALYLKDHVLHDF